MRICDLRAVRLRRRKTLGGADDWRIRKAYGPQFLPFYADQSNVSNQHPRPLALVPLFPFAAILILWLADNALYREHLGGPLYPIVIVANSVAVGIYASHSTRSARLILLLIFVSALAVAVGGLVALVNVDIRHGVELG